MLVPLLGVALSCATMRRSCAMPLTTDDVAALAPSDHTVVTDANLADMRRAHAHPFTSEPRLRAGDVVWTPYFPSGNHIVVVWVSEQRAGLGRNGHLPPDEGRIAVVDGELEITTAAGKRFRLRDGVAL
jgi:hypothetical protein